jgi:hypothetical protein
MLLLVVYLQSWCSLRVLGGSVSAVILAACWSWAGGADLGEASLERSQLLDVRCGVCSLGLA